MGHYESVCERCYKVLSNPAYDRRDEKLGGVGGFTRENAIKGYENSLALLTPEQRSNIGKKAYKASLAKIDHAVAGRKGGLANKGKPKVMTEAHKQAIRDAWVRKKQMRE